MGICARLLGHSAHGRLTTTRIRVSPQVQRRFSACMCKHGLPGFQLDAGKKASAAYIDAHLGEFRRASAACSGLLLHLTP